MTDKKVWLDLRNRRKNISKRQETLLNTIKRDGKIPFDSISQYNDIRSVNALMRKKLVQYDSTRAYYVLDNIITDELIDHYCKNG